MSDAGQRTVLVVDDEELFRNSVVDALGKACPEFRVLEAGDGKQALRQVRRSGGVDVVVTDIRMPEMGGLELILALRERSYAGRLIVMTAYGNSSPEEHSEALGAFRYFEKPLDLPELVGSIKSAAEGRGGRVSGVTLAGFAQLLELEGETCLLQVSSGGETGDLVFRNGLLAHAGTAVLTGDEAAVEILRWDDDAQLDLLEGFVGDQQTVTQSLQDLLRQARPQAAGDQGTAPGTEASARERVDSQSSSLGDISTKPEAEKERIMSNVKESLDKAMEIDGAIGVALVDYESGMSLGQAGGGKLDLEVAAAGNTEVVRSKMKVMDKLGLNERIEDILITLGKQYHLIRPLEDAPNLFVYLALTRDKANLAMARHELARVEKGLEL